MSKKTTLGDPVQGPASLVRPHFSAGLLLEDDDLTAGVTYTRALSRLMFRTIFGCGVLCGLKVGEPEENRCGDLSVPVAKGVALDCSGDPVEVPTDQSVVLSCDVDVGDEVWVALRRRERCCAPRTAVCSEDAEPPAVCTRERDGFEIQLFAERPCACGCTNPQPQDASESLRKAPTKKKSSAKAVAAAAVAIEETSQPTAPEDDCLCTHRHGVDQCYHDHYDGKCPCDCCDGEWVLLAVARHTENGWTVDHSVRRFVRPVLMRDPLAGV